jgi:hypothetical protein
MVPISSRLVFSGPPSDLFPYFLPARNLGRHRPVMRGSLRHGVASPHGSAVAAEFEYWRQEIGDH